ncbi:baseplate J/gp47 family protein [Mucilaginibacter sp. BJC16-A38]|uniref:baseplate J/gp47 family protein n=1 Tax=Mucilaginibacter phenanthrenivorans TaxID=1234842 RepID=UPI0021581C24|nr:baseplate J/gp47 family protein [Mucilaginibacter phenanthrenivorans]MCR8557644.1 baseplate J/gp47 family protein [Mucilaginibacter phenanthrenivorans]
MAKNCLDTGLLSYNGTSQAQRSLDALLANCPKVDERTTADLILFTKKYGAYLNFYDLTNTIAGDWQALMGNDSAVIIAGLADWKTQDYALFIKTITDSAINATTDADAKSYFKVLFDFVFSLATALDKAYHQLPDGSEYGEFLSVSIASSLSTPLNGLLYYYDQFKNNLPDSLIDETSTFTYNGTPVDDLVLSQNFNIPALTAPFNIDTTFVTNNILMSGVLRDDINHILTHNLFSGIYQAFIDGVTNIISRTPGFLANMLDTYPSHTPHYALYLAFLKLFAFAQEHLNQYTKRNLDFYYKDVLALTNNAAEADFVHLVFSLQKNINQHLIPAGTEFKAGKDANKNDLFYATTNDVVLQTASVQELKALYLNKGMNPATLFAAPVANSQDGQGAKLLSADGSWFPFGGPQQNITHAGLGFAIASKVLYLNEGTRTVTLTFNCNNLTGVTQASLSDIFTVELTGLKGWYTATGYTPKVIDSTSFSLTITLEGDAPAIVPFNAKLHTGNFTAALPMVRLTLDSSISYQIIKNLRIKTIGVTATVNAAKNLALQNDDGKIDASKPFKVFGDFPDSGASFIIGSKEIFQKDLTSLTINLDWQQEPHSNITTQISSLVKGVWKPVNSSSVSLYASSITITPATQKVSAVTAAQKSGQVKFDKMLKLTPKFEVETLEDYITFEKGGISAKEKGFGSATLTEITGDTYYLIGLPAVTTTGLENVVQSQPDFTANGGYAITSVDGYIELTLNNTDYNLSTFINSIPQPSVTVLTDGATPPNVTGYQVNKVTTPIAAPPAIKSISISYTAEDNLLFNDFNDRSSYYYHVEPFGYREMHPAITTDAPLTFLPVFNLDDNNASDNGGELWIGLANALPDETFSVLFEVSDGSANPLKNMTEVDWYYLSANNWILFDKQSVTDQTNNLTTSGLVIFNVPGQATLNNTRVDSNLIWIKAVVAHDTDAVCKLIAVDTNATRAQFVQDIAKGIAFTNVLPPNTISKPAIPDGALKQTQQPYSSFGGRVAETDDQFYVRVSERLRHKHRAITAWDYERLTLQYFPQIFKAKCLNHTGFILDEKTNQPRYSETLAGQAMVITIPDLTHLNTANILRPYTSIGLLTEIQAYLKTLTSPFVRLNVCNPQFEEVQFDFAVTFRENYDPTFFSNQLNDDIEQFLTPWAFGNPQAISFNTTIQKSVVLNFIEERYYVDFVTCFKMNQFVRDGETVVQYFPDIEEAVPSTARSILVSYYDETTKVKHLISTPAKCDCI